MTLCFQIGTYKPLSSSIRRNKKIQSYLEELIIQCKSKKKINEIVN
jgi:hypothetical protein